SVVQWDKDAAAARTTHPIPPACGIYYYEVHILSKGNKGFAGKDVRLSRLPGWGQIHGDIMGMMAALSPRRRMARHSGPPLAVIGCGVDFSTYQAFFTKNGTLIEFSQAQLSKTLESHLTYIHPLAFAIPGKQSASTLDKNLSKFDIEYHVHQQRIQTWSNILTTPIDPSFVAKAAPVTEEQTKSAIDKLVLSYLAHHGYAKTARAFQKQSLGSSGVSTAGDIDTALSETQEHYPAVLEADEGLMLFKMRCRKFVELLLDATELHKRMKTEDNVDDDEMGMDVDDDAVPLGSSVSPRFGTKSVSFSPARRQVSPGRERVESGDPLRASVLNDYTSDKRPEVQTLFNRTVGIVAWHDPIEQGALRPKWRPGGQRSQGRPAHPPLETIYRHTAALIHQLAVSGVGAAAFADMQKEFIDA
ncbi:hypothetical protein B0H17DRAFT_1155039, partial [Mycena rosella]